MSGPNSATLLLLSMWAAVARGPEPPLDCWRHPPEPNPAAPADFVAWAQGCASRGVTDNAWDTYRELNDVLTLPPLEVRTAVSFAVRWPWDPDRFAVAVDWLEASGPAFAILRRGAERRGCYVPLERGGEFLLDIRAPNRSVVRRAARGMAASGWRQFYQGRTGPIIADAVVLLRVVHHMDEATSVTGFSGPGLFARMVHRDMLLLYLDRVSGRAEQASVWAPRILRADPPYLSDSRMVMMQYARLADLYQRIYRRNAENGRLEMDRAAIEPFRDRLPLLHRLSDEEFDGLLRSDYDESIRLLDGYYFGLLELVDEPYVQAREAIRELESGLDANGTALTRATILPLSRILIERDKTVATRRATHLVYSIWEHRVRTGEFPARLRDLDVPRLAELRRDPFSSGDFGYRLVEDGFRLYSLGLDGADQEGRHAEDWGARHPGDYVFWPVQPVTPPWQRPRILITSDGRVIEQPRDGSPAAMTQPAPESPGASSQPDVESEVDDWEDNEPDRQ